MAGGDARGLGPIHLITSQTDAFDPTKVLLTVAQLGQWQQQQQLRELQMSDLASKIASACCSWDCTKIYVKTATASGSVVTVDVRAMTTMGIPPCVQQVAVVQLSV
jgi:hypothetical protein